MRGIVHSIAVISASAFLGQAALAADFPVKAPMAPVMAPAFNWSGLYVGIDAGYAWGSSTVNDISGYNGAGGVGDFSYNPRGFQGDLRIGYNWQINQFVIGGEGEFGYLGIDKSQQYPPYVGVRTAADSVANTSNGWYGALSGRVGIAFNNFLLFAKGGGVFTSIDNSFNDTDPVGLILVSNTTTSKRTGWTAGGGVEFAFNQNWAARVEYAHYDFGTESHTAVANSGTSYTFRHSLTLDSVRVGLTYLFH